MTRTSGLNGDGHGPTITDPFPDPWRLYRPDLLPQDSAMISLPTLRRSPAVALLCVLLLAACGGDSGGEAEKGGLEGPDRSLDWEATPVFTVGGLEAPNWAAFGSVAQVEFDADGYLYIRDGQTDVVTVVDPEGGYAGTVGQVGEGPGEIRQAFGMAVTPEGRVVISDFGSQGLVVYERNGTWAGNVSLNVSEEGLPGSDATALGEGIVSASALRFTMSSGGDDVDIRAGEPEGRPIWWYPVSEGDTARRVVTGWDPPPPPEGGEAELNAGDGGERLQIRMQRLQAFEPGFYFAALSGQRLALVDSTTYRIRVVNLDGALLGTVERPIVPRPVTESVQEAERERRIAEVEDRSGGGGLRVMGGGDISVDPAAVRNMMLDRVETMAFYPEIPVVEALAADGFDRLWVQRASGEPGEPGPTDVVTPEGDYLGTLPPDGLRIPDAFGPDGLAAYIELDDLDVATVRVVRVPDN